MFFDAEEAKSNRMKELIPKQFDYYVEGIGILVIGLPGLAINIVALYILFNRKVIFY
jgi:hypothetical protein